MYQSIRSKVFCSKFLQPNTLYEISAGYHCVRIRPYDGGHAFDFLRWSDVSFGRTIKLPKNALNIAELPNRVYAVEIDGVFYLIDPAFRGDPTAVHFIPQPMYYYMSEDIAFFKEAEAVTEVDWVWIYGKKDKYNRYKYFLPKDFCKTINITEATDIAISIFSSNGREWMEIRNAKKIRATLYPQLDRLAEEFTPELSGLTVCKRYGRGGLGLIQMFPGNWDKERLVCWYSKVRNAIILEDAPKQCAICGETLRSIEQEHFAIKVCHECEPHLGNGNSIDIIMTAQKAAAQAEEIINKHS